MRVLIPLALMAIVAASVPVDAKEKKHPEAAREIAQSKASDADHRTVTSKRHRKSYDDPFWGANFKQTLRQSEVHISHSVVPR